MRRLAAALQQHAHQPGDRSPGPDSIRRHQHVGQRRRPDVHVAGRNPFVVNNLITVAPGNHTRMVDIRLQSYTGELTLDHNLYFDQDLDAALFINRNVLGDAAGEVYLSSWQTQNGFDQNSLLADPQLDAGFHLLPGSPAIGKAISLAGLAFDLDGNPRGVDPPEPDADPPSEADPPQPDLGADEFNAGLKRATPPAAFGAPTLRSPSEPITTMRSIVVREDLPPRPNDGHGHRGLRDAWR